MKENYSVVGFFAREHGMEGLEALISSDRYTPICVFTHKKNPLSQDPDRNEREDFDAYVDVADKNDIPLYTVDSKRDASEMDRILKETEFDLMASISWRRIIPKEHLALPKYGGVNIHRGKLPDYAGAEPIVRALENGDKFIYNTAHVLAEEVDGGEVIAEYMHPVNYDSDKSLQENVERLKKEITPSYGKLLIYSLDNLTSD